MKKAIHKMLSALVVLSMVGSMMPISAFAADETVTQYAELTEMGSLLSDAEVHVYATNNGTDFGGSVAPPVTNGSTFMQGSGYRQFTATANEGWIFDGWTTQISRGNNSTENRQAGNYYSFSKSYDRWSVAYDYEAGNETISANRLTTWGETTLSPIYYYLWANFNPTITAITADNGSITHEGETEVEYGYTSELYTITADAGYVISDVLVDGQSVAQPNTATSFLMERNKKSLSP